MKLDKYKQAVLDAYTSTTSNIFVSATAGSGKSYLLLRILEATPSYKDVLFVAFNKAIVEDLDRKVMGRAEVKTIHSKAFSTLLKNKRCRFKLSKWRDYAICRKYVYAGLNMEEKKMNHRIMNISAIYNLMRINLVGIEEEERLREICVRWDVDFDDSYYKELKQFVREVNHDINDLKVKELEIDFTDQLYLTWKYIPEGLFPKYDVILCDEAQDLNPLQRELILRMLKPHGRLVVVGDESQCIFSFQGSSVDSFHLLRDRPNTITLPLSMTYRCPKKVVELASKYSDNIEAMEDAPDGVVRPGTLDEVMPGDYLICRNNLPLVEAFIALMQKGKRATIMGRDYGEGLLRLLDRVERPEDLITILQEKRQELLDRGIINFKANEGFIALAEKVEIIRILHSRMGGLDEVRRTVTTLFSNDHEEGDVILSTIHKSKGLEADRVFILGFDELIPSEYATTELELYGERCLQFVAVTRAKKELIFIPYKTKERNVRKETETVRANGGL